MTMAANPEIDAPSADSVPEHFGFDAVFEELNTQRAAGLHRQAGVAVFLDGELVLDVAHPSKNNEGTRPLFRAFSAGKPLAAAVIWRLIDAGRVSLGTPVAEYWPEFAQAGKSGITVRHVLTHTSGLALDTTRSDVDWMDWGRVVDALSVAEPLHEPGVLMQYHAFTFGWLVGEIAARVTGESFESCFDREVRQPLALHDTHYVIQRDDYSSLDRVVKLRTGRGFDDPALPSKMDGLLMLQVSFPAGSCVTSAHDLARFYSAIVNEPSDDAQPIYADSGDETVRPWLSQRTRELVYETHAEMFDLDESRIARFGLGLAFADHQPNRMAAPPGSNAFGHGGLGTCVGWADPEHGMSVAILTDTALPESENYQRHNRISAAVREGLGMPTGELAVW